VLGELLLRVFKFSCVPSIFNIKKCKKGYYEENGQKLLGFRQSLPGNALKSY
jgi:hypothetical protein